MANKSKAGQCRIQRRGVLRKMDGDTAVLEVEGKPVKVPANKLSQQAKAGDLLAWDGQLWVRIYA